MARIVYGVCGEGRGHATRSRILIEFLKENHDVFIVAGGRAYDLLSKEWDAIERIESAHFVYRKGQAHLPLTILRTLYRTLVSAPASYRKVQQVIRTFQPDIILSDAEPLCFYAAHKFGLKRVSIDNPHAMLHRKYPLAIREILPWLILVGAMKIVLFNADCYIIYDFFDSPSKHSNVVFFKPLIQKRICQQKQTEKDYIFVYQTTVTSDVIIPLLQSIDAQFIVYGHDIDTVDENITFRRFNETVFYEDIASAKAIVTTAGFTVISEALYLKKPLFVLPVKYQMEQVVNGKFVQQLGAGVARDTLCRKELVNFLDNLDVYRKNLKRYDPGHQQKILQGIELEIMQVLSL